MKLKYPIYLEKGSETTAYGVMFPDFDGLFAAGDTREQALTHAKEVLLERLNDYRQKGQPYPKPSVINDELIRANPLDEVHQVEVMLIAQPRTS